MFRRRLLGVLSLLSLILCVAMVVLWVRSYWIADRLIIQKSHYRQVGSDEEDADLLPSYRGRVASYAMRINRGSIGVHVERSVELNLGPENLRDWKQDWPEGTLVMWNRDEADAGSEHLGIFNIVNENDVLDRFGFFFGTADRTGISSFIDFRLTEASVPAWSVVMLLAISPAVRLVRFARSRRRNTAGLCPSCGYDWRATPGRCSECGWREVGGDAK